MRFIAGPNGTPGNHLLEVWRNGRREPLALRADTSESWVERYVTNAAGEVVTLLSLVQTETVYGDVQIHGGAEYR